MGDMPSSREALIDTWDKSRHPRMTCRLLLPYVDLLYIKASPISLNDHKSVLRPENKAARFHTMCLLLSIQLVLIVNTP